MAYENGIKKYCPLTKRECARAACAWWSGKGQYAQCGILDAGNLGYKVYKIQQILERGGGCGAPAGSGFVDEPAPRKAAPQTGVNYPDSDEDFDDGPF
jgi:hypothetical protein